MRDAVSSYKSQQVRGRVRVRIRVRVRVKVNEKAE